LADGINELTDSPKKPAVAICKPTDGINRPPVSSNELPETPRSPADEAKTLEERTWKLADGLN
jgi:hypothetical protein